MLGVALLAVGVLVVLPASAAGPQFHVFSVPTAHSSPAGIAKDGAGNVWFAEYSVNQVGELTTSGVFHEYPLPTATSFPIGIALGPDGNMWATESGTGQIARVTPAGHVTEFPTPTMGSGPTLIAAGPDGAMWFTERGVGQIGRITTAGTVTNEFPVPASPAGPADLYGIAKGPDGNLWFTDFSENRVGKITTSGHVTMYSKGIVAGGHPAGITAGPDGNVWFTEYDGNRVGRITPSGKVTEFGAPSGGNPAGITAASDGNVWFTESTANKIAKVTPAGKVTEYTLPGSGNTPKYIADPGGKLVTDGADGNNLFTLALVAAPTGFPQSGFNLLKAMNGYLADMIGEGRAVTGEIEYVQELKAMLIKNDFAGQTVYGQPFASVFTPLEAIDLRLQGAIALIAGGHAALAISNVTAAKAAKDKLEKELPK